MGLPNNLFALAFRQQKLGVMLTVIMAIMVYLATLAMALQTSLADVSTSWGNDLQGRLTVEIPPPSDGAEKSQSELVKSVLNELKSFPGVKNAEKLPEKEVSRLLSPWISEKSVLESLPVPVLIDIQSSDAQTLDTEALDRKLLSIHSGIKIDNHADWLSQLLNIVHSLSFIAGLMVLLTAATLAITIALICRAAMALQHETIELLHVIGATDKDIVKQFQIHTRKLSLPAAITGFLLALLTILLLSSMMEHFLGHAPSFNFSWTIFISVMAAVPVAAVVLAVATARISILGLLRQMP